MYRLGGFELHAVSDGTFRLDGGAMFGIVPKPLWEKVVTPDDRNRITLALNCLLIRTGQKNVLVDTGMGDKHDAKFIEIYAEAHETRLLDDLARLGVRPEEIDFVVLSHLHFDHAGGATRRAGGELVPTFPRAAYIVQEGMWAEALAPNPRTKGSYFEDDFVPLKKAGRVRFVTGEEEVTPGVRVLHTGGHVKHHQVVMAESQGEKAIFWADLLPTSMHVKPSWVMGYDLFPHEAALIKERMVEQAVRERWVSVFEHDPEVALGRIEQEPKGYRVEPIERVRKRG
jgi:glyoxylase-like metal-dependent hydrolase (beta-lactamase superfamily II)